MQDLAIGCDIEEIVRFSIDLNKNNSFLERVFTHQELKYCFSHGEPARHLAVRFCAKESVVKAFSSVGIHKLSYKSIEICSGEEGVPHVRLHPETIDPCLSSTYDIFISLSHTVTVAMAIAIVRKR